MRESGCFALFCFVLWSFINVTIRFNRCRLSYAVYVLQELEKDNADNPRLKINILYDIACMLVKHLQVKINLVWILVYYYAVWYSSSEFTCYYVIFSQNLDEDPILDMFQFAIPIFHCYGHNGPCQVCFRQFLICNVMYSNMDDKQLVFFCNV